MYSLFILFYISISPLIADERNVVELTPLNFDQTVKQSKAIWVIQFYSPDCLFCQKFAPEYERTAEKLKGMGVKVGRIDAVQYDKFSDQYDVRGYPTLKLFGYNKDSPEDYHGPRKAEDIINVVANLQQGKKTRSNYDSGWNFLTVDIEPQCMKNVEKVDTGNKNG